MMGSWERPLGYHTVYSWKRSPCLALRDGIGFLVQTAVYKGSVIGDGTRVCEREPNMKKSVG